MTSKLIKAGAAIRSAIGEGGPGPHHGGRLLEARRRFPDAPEPFLDLSTGINPVPYPVPTLPRQAYTRLPEPEELDALCAAAARAYRAADVAMVAAAPGTQLLIELLPRLFPLRSVAVLSPTYNEHAPAWSRAGAAVRPVADVAALAGGQGAVVCNPNNPDGRRLAADDLVELAATLAAKGGLLVVDEAFADFAEPGLSLAPLLPRPGVVVLRSFGKAYGLAGLRLGFALAEPAVAGRIRAGLGPWPVSGAAVHVGRAALGDAAWRAETAGRLAADVARLDAWLTGAGFRVVGGTPLFRLAQGGHAAATFDWLGRAGILVRAFDERADWLRFGLPGAAAEWGRLGSALSARRFP